ncbi:terminase large subunit [Mycobacterium phage FF47]|uniref:Terminase large subunit n=2 Tax=Mapvirus Ff47 TaxID=1920751 RepID=A0A899IN75_9CAUD|nr:terminase large subunit [Mycobacterium phage FF47]QSL99612.1 hypothetical protein [Mycobacterium phage Maco2]QXN76683.1 hypothetical protein [Mycobacterium phage Maco7]UNY41925.1 hypothetical protein [Mycobacterium phage Maco6]WKV22182.1 terminase large subunit [Mycobacteroides phage 8UZL]AGI12273.1 terminase large subunit [Mycobacterium phage FF47]
MPWKPTVPGEIPTMGYIAIEWMKEYLAAPDCAEYEPFVPYLEQEDILLEWYALWPDGTRRFNRGVVGRSRGWGKSPFLAAISCLEALGPIKFDGWDANGQPVGRPWSTVRTPLVQITAVDEKQTANTWGPVLEMLREEAPIHSEYSVNPMETFVALPNRGRMECRTASSRSIKGARAHFAVLDQTEEWVPSNGGPRLARTMRVNAAKVGGTTLESPNAYTPGEGSVAEASAKFWDDIKRGRAKSEGLYYNHREAPPETDFDSDDSLMAGLRVAYGDSSGHPDGCVIHDPPCPPGHVDLPRILETIHDPTQEEEDSRTDFLNQITESADAWISHLDIKATRDDEHRTLDPRDEIVLGFDGSRGRVKGKPDATALVGVRVSDGFTWECKVWEAKLNEKDWIPPVLEVDEEVDLWFERCKVIGFYADPSGWTEWVSKWEARYRRKLKVKATTNHPISLWPRGKTQSVYDAVKAAHDAIATREMVHDGSPNLCRHLINARKRDTPRGYLLYKAYPMSPDKIDAAYAFVLAWKARMDALSQGYGKTREEKAHSGKVLIS